MITHRIYCAAVAAIAALSFFASTGNAEVSQKPKSGVPDFTTHNDVRYFVLEKWSARTQDINGLEAFARELVDKSAKYRAPEGALDGFYGHLALMTYLPEQRALMQQWRTDHPASSVPVLAPLVGREMASSGEFRLTLSTLKTWDRPAPAVRDLAKVRSDLLEAKPLAANDPYWYTFMALLDVALKRDPSEIRALVEEGLKQNPNNYELVVMASNRFLAKWSGEAGDLDKFAVEMSDRFKDREGFAMYARIYAQAQAAQYGSQLFKISKVDWTRLMAGIRDLVARYPDAAHQNQGALLACLGGNRALTREIMGQRTFSKDPAVWYQLNINQTWDAYSICRTWANEHADLGESHP